MRYCVGFGYFVSKYSNTKLLAEYNFFKNYNIYYHEYWLNFIFIYYTTFLTQVKVYYTG